MSHSNSTPYSFVEPPLIQALAAKYEIEKGEHPAFWQEVFAKLPPYTDPKTVALWQENGLPLQMCSNGHNVIVDGKGRGIPVSPLFVRDLSGRIIYTGTGPEVKEGEEWEHNPHITFPKGCRDVTSSVVGAEKLEKVLMTSFRALDVSPKTDFVISGRQHPAQVLYSNLNLYPYKLRLDTFYTDGWRLPQTQMLYVRPVKDAEKTQNLAKEFLQRWSSRPNNQDYTAFYEAHGGDKFVEKLFVQGITVIPTFEAYNGYNKVGESFELEDFWPGRAVKGLHEVTEVRSDVSPKGTILEVVEPGYVMHKSVKQAKVIVSDGSQYQTPHNKDTPPYYPDLRLPHQRTRAVWGSTWVPTHPSHFEQPAMWGWDVDTGRFLQLSGPLWDPLHYYYASVVDVLRAVRQTPAGEDVYIPKEMKERFYPVVSMKQYDTLSIPTLESRESTGAHIQSAVDHVPFNQVCGIGYHPLPLMYEDELDSFMFPELAPKYRLRGKPVQQLMDVIQSSITPEQAIKATIVTPSSQNLKEERHFAESKKEMLKDYPQLKRYLSETKLDEIVDQVPLWLKDVQEMELQRNIRRAVGGKKQKERLENWQEGLFDGVSNFREKSLWWRRLRHRLFRKYPGWYVQGWWNMDFPEESEGKARAKPYKHAKTVREKLIKLTKHTN